MKPHDSKRIAEWIERAPQGAVRILFSDDPGALAPALATCLPRTGATVVQPFAGPPPLGSALKAGVEALAAAARAFWPDWYGSPPGTAGLAPDPETFLRAAVTRWPAVLERWLVAARALVLEGRLPLVYDLAAEVHARQLALALDPERLLIALALHQAARGDPRLSSFVRACEWLAAATEARLVALLPSDLEGDPLLDPIAYGSARLGQPPAAAPAGTTVAHPVVGRPHPLSSVEERVAKQVLQDAELRSLFAFNQRIETVRGSHPVVDLVWQDGRIIIELDGYETHGGRLAFASDRHRDYELALSGYLVLRLTNEEVLDDIELAIDKIRDVVRLRRSKPPATRVATEEIQ